jgi:hypothetical protein
MMHELFDLTGSDRSEGWGEGIGGMGRDREE